MRYGKTSTAVARHSTNTRTARRNRAIALAALGLLSAGSPLFGANKTFVGPAGGDWNTSSYWLQPGVPSPGDWAFFQPTGSGSYSYDGNYTSGSPLGSLTLGNGGTSTPTLNQSSGTLNAGVETVSSGTFAQAGGINGIASALYVFDAIGSTGTFKLTGGSLSADSAYVGYSAGVGTFLQKAGSCSIGSELFVGSGTSSTGALTLSAGTLSGGSADIGSGGGVGTFLQDGTRTFSSFDNSFGVGDGSGAIGVASVLGGAFSAGAVQVGNAGGTGTFTQTAGSTDLGSRLDVGSVSSGTVLLTGGLLQSSSTYVGEFGGAGTYLQSAGQGHLGTTVGFGDGIGSTGVASLSGGSLFGGVVVVGNSGGSGTFLQSGTLSSTTLASEFTFGQGTSATGFGSLSAGTITATYLGVGYMGGTGTFVQSGGSSSFQNEVAVGFSAGSSGTYLLSGGSMSAVETIIGGSGGVGTFVQSGSLTSSNLGTVAVASASALTLSGGTLQVSRIISSGTVAVSGGTLAITSAGTLGAGSLTGISIGGPGVVDIGSSALVISYGTNPSPIGELTPNGHTQNYPAGSIQAYIKSAFDGGLWDNPGLTSSAAANDPFGLTAVGALDQNDLNNAEGQDYTSSTWMGLTITSDNSVLVRFTYYGDSDLDGIVGPADVNNLELGFQGFGDGWIYGDFNYDGLVDGQDVNLLDLNYENIPLGDVRALTLQQAQWLLANEKGLSPEQLAAFEARVGVPEPMAVGVLGIAATGLLGRRRRRHSAL